jgi:hypothetical protein
MQMEHQQQVQHLTLSPLLQFQVLQLSVLQLQQELQQQLFLSPLQQVTVEPQLPLTQQLLLLEELQERYRKQDQEQLLFLVFLKTPLTHSQSGRLTLRELVILLPHLTKLQLNCRSVLDLNDSSPQEPSLQQRLE